MNKKQQIGYNLNTINIGYKRRERIDLSPPPAQQGDSSEDEDKMRVEHVTLDPSNNNQLEVEFNDSRLMEQGKSQTMKEAHFNKMRIHIHRKEKNSKWLDLAVRSPRNLQLLEAREEEMCTSLVDRRKDLKTVLVRRRLVDPSVNKLKIKVKSSERKRTVSPDKVQSRDKVNSLMVSQNIKQSLKRNIQQPKFQTIRQPEKDKIVDKHEKHMTKLDKLLNEVVTRAEKSNRDVQVEDRSKDKKRNFSDNTTNIRRRLAKLQMKRYVIPFRFKQPQQKKSFVRNEANIEEIIHENDFKAWGQDQNIFNSKHGIQQYTIEQTAEPSKEPSPKRVGSSKKKKHRNHLQVPKV